MKLSKSYEPSQYESDIYKLWERSEAFKPTGQGEPFVIVMPPPNANAKLHIGHVLGFGLEDTVIRYQRMKGRDALWLPSADHAGFETQVVYEKHLAKEGKSRFDFSREDLYNQIFDFVNQNREQFNNIFRQLGASCDWSRFTFTLDEKVIKVAYSSFKKMWDDGLIYRGERLVNYCTHHRTGFADIEVKYEDRVTPLYYMKYGPFVVATTRPETKFGDTAVAVHPGDKRYKKYIGQTIMVDGLNGPFEMRVVADEMVDPNFGTGVVKITPAHDVNDWEVAQRHNLPAVRVINHDGTMNHMAGQFEGMTVLEARKAVVEALKEKGLLVKVDENYKNRVGVCYKCGTVIESMLLDQWFINMEQLAKPAIKALKEGKIKFYPANKCQQVIDYLSSVRDWNISRQIAWGIPIPAFQNVDDLDEWIFDERTDQEIIEVDGKTYHRDPDVFDTWFTSGQLPYITTGFPDSKDFDRYYPTNLMETGVEILYQWVARMICLGIYVAKDIPFKEVYLHGMVRGTDGRKMSKSLGNVIDPTELIEKYGADAVRLGMMAGRTASYSSAYAPGKITAARNLCNKLWNIARYTENITGDVFKDPKNPKPVSLADNWILSELDLASKEIAKDLDDYNFAEAYEKLYHFVWDDLADWYIEASKIEPNNDLLVYLLEETLKLSHPFAPFVTETIWQTLHAQTDSLLIRQKWPNHEKFDKKAASDFSQIQTIVSETRAISAELDLKKPNLLFTRQPFIHQNSGLIKGLAKLSDCIEVEKGRGMRLTKTNINCWLDIDAQTAQNYIGKLTTRKIEKEITISKLQSRLSNTSYTANAPKEIVEQTREQLADESSQLEKINQELEKFQATNSRD